MTGPQDDLTRHLAAIHKTQQVFNRRLCAIEAAMKLAALGRAPTMPIEFRSQFGEDSFLWEFFGGALEGFFIEVGAFNGFDASVTYALEAVGWKGLLIEPIPERYEECRARRRNSRVVNAALGPPGSPPTTTFYVTEDVHGGMLSYLDPTSEHAKTANVTSRREVTVPMTTMDALLADHTGEIDVAVIDVEGYEVPLLKGFDLRRHRPKIMLIEDNSRGRRADLDLALAGAPYKQIGWVEVNRIYIRDDLTHMLSRLS
jgi:FkbM family methyltransferase